MSEPTLPPSPDDDDREWGEPTRPEESADEATDRRLREDRPPHHDRDRDRD